MQRLESICLRFMNLLINILKVMIFIRYKVENARKLPEISNKYVPNVKMICLTLGVHSGFPKTVELLQKKLSSISIFIAIPFNLIFFSVVHVRRKKYFVYFSYCNSRNRQKYGIEISGFTKKIINKKGICERTSEPELGNFITLITVCPKSLGKFRT